VQKGMIDSVVHRRDMKEYISRALDWMSPRAV
jgi:acetyl-CoA carboxylase beta subunit